ncbi:hypothetical protein V6O07_04470, partial [Arthrospira platensis SPKY2]
RTIAPVPITLNGSTPGYERITRTNNTSWYSDWLFRSLGEADLRTGTDPEVVYPIVLERLEADALVRRVSGPEALNRQVWLLEPEEISVSTETLELACGRCGRRETTLAENAEMLAGLPCTRIGCGGELQPASTPPRTA